MGFWIPAIVFGSMAAGAVSQIYASHKNIQYQKSAMSENNRFWSDYERNTGVKARYPYRSGSVYNTNSLYNSYSSSIRAHTSLIGYGAAQYNRNKRGDWLYW